MPRQSTTRTPAPKRRPHKRENGAGSVYQRGDGKWVAAVSIDDKRVTKCAAARMEAEAKLHALLNAQEVGELIPPFYLTLGQRFEPWLALVEG